MPLAELRQIVEEHLPLFDDVLAKRLVPLPQRPFESAALFVTHVIIEIEGQNKEDFLKSKWFGDIYRWTALWYQKRYGDAMRQEKPNFAKGAVLIFGTAFELKFPLTVTKPHIPGEVVALTFPDSLLPDEKALDWLGAAPNIAELTTSERDQLQSSTVEVVEARRTTHANIVTADTVDPQTRSLTDAIQQHLDRAADELCTSEATRVLYAIWEVHMAVEKAIKAHLRQRGVAAPNTHDLIKLHSLASRSEAPEDVTNAIAELPRAQVAIAARYGEQQLPLTEVYQAYRRALDVIVRYTASYRRSYVFKGATFYIRRLPWAEFSA